MGATGNHLGTASTNGIGQLMQGVGSRRNGVGKGWGSVSVGRGLPQMEQGREGWIAQHKLSPQPESHPHFLSSSLLSLALQW